MRIIELSLRRRVTVAMAAIALILFGAVAFTRLSVNLLPDISYPTLTVETHYPGAAPAEVEALLTRPIEEAVGVVAGVERLTSESRPGVSQVTLELSWGRNMDFAALDVRQKLDLVTLPKEAERPVLLRFDPSNDPIQRLYAVPVETAEGAEAAAAAPDLFRLRYAAEEVLKKDLESADGVAAVKVHGGLEEEIQVRLDEGKLALLGLTIEEVSKRLLEENVNQAGGSLYEEEARYIVRSRNELQSLEDILATVLVSHEGRNVTLGEVATVERGARQREVVTRFRGAEAVELAVYKEGDANTVAVARAVRERLANLGDELPAGVEVVTGADQSRFIEASIREVLSNAALGGVIAVFVLLFFLKDPRSTLIIGISIPISIIATFFLMYRTGTTLNIMSLGGLALGVGMLVDNAIVVLEAIFKRREEGLGAFEAARQGASEVGRAVAASTLTTVAVFLPVVFLEGIAAQLFRDQALTVSFSLIASLAVALTLIPMMAALLGGKKSARVDSANERGGDTASGGSADEPAGEARNADAPFGFGLASSSPRPPSLGETAGDRGGLAPSGSGLASSSTRPPSLGGDSAGRPAGESRDADAPFGLGLASSSTSPPTPSQVSERWYTRALAFAVRTVRLALRGVGFVVALPFRPLSKAFDAGLGLVSSAYPAVLRWALRSRGVVLATAALGFAWAVWMVPRLGVDLIPSFSQGEFSFAIELPEGTPLEATDRFVAEAQSVLDGDPRVASYSSIAGGAGLALVSNGAEGENAARIEVRMAPGTSREDEEAVAATLRRRLAASELADFELARPTYFSFRTPIEVELYGENLAELVAAAEQTQAALEAVPGLVDLESSAELGNPELQVSFRRDQLSRLGMNAFQVATTVRNKIQGEVATRFLEGDREIDIVVRSVEKGEASAADLGSLILGQRDGVPIYLGSVADVEVAYGPSEIRRIGQRRAAVVSGNLEGRDMGAVAADVRSALAALALPAGVTASLSGQEEEMARSLSSLLFALGLASFLVYLVMASQFESFLHPFVIVFTLPLAAIGVVAALALTGQTLNVVAMIGVVMLAGIVVNNAIVLVDAVNRLRAEGVERTEALVQAGAARLRPILMTSATTVFGLLPMALGLGEGAELRAPLAVTVIGGLTLATLLTLVVIPVVYSLLDRKRFAAKAADAAAAPEVTVEVAASPVQGAEAAEREATAPAPGGTALAPEISP